MAGVVCHKKKMKNGVGAPTPHFHQTGWSDHPWVCCAIFMAQTYP